MKWKRLVFLLLWLGLGHPGPAQHIVWEKVFGAISIDQLGAVTTLEDSSYLALGLSPTLGGFVYYPTGSPSIGSIIMRIDKNGDTLYTRRLNVYSTVSNENTNLYIGPKFGDIYWAVIAAQIPLGTGSVSCPAVVEFTAEGQVFQTHILADYQNWRPKGAIATADNGLIISGYFQGGLTLPTQMMSIKVNFLGEVEWANKWIPPAQVRGIGERIFQTKPNEYLVTGTLGRRIGGFTFDSAGNQLSTKVFYDTPSMIQFYSGEASVASSKSFVSVGEYKNTSNLSIGYFGMLDSLNNKLWGGEKRGGFYKPQANIDGSVWVEHYDPNDQYIRLKKFGPDSTLLKQIPIYQVSTIDFQYYQYLPIGANQVIAVGFKQVQGLSNQFLITKIDSFGVPITATEKHLSKPPADYRQIVAFPNPTTQSVQFKQLDVAGHLRLYNLKGQIVREKDIQPEEEVSLHGLAAGEYLWHIATLDKKTYTGRILKE